MIKIISTTIILILWFAAWYLGAHISLMGEYHYYKYIVALLVMIGFLIFFGKKLGRYFAGIGIFGLIVVLALNILTSPHRFERVQAWLGSLFS